jgi:ATP-dependent HslUV protease subunit HslV
MELHGTTILAVKKKGKIAVAGDGQVTLGGTIVKHNAKKVRRIYNNKIIVGFAGATADALNLFDKLESKLERFNGNLVKSAVELAKEWRKDKYLRRLEAMMIAVDKKGILLISGSGDVIEPDDDFISIGSGGLAAHAAAQALVENTEYDAVIILKKAMEIVSKLCVYTNESIVIESIKI